MKPYKTIKGVDISAIPAEIMYNILLRLPIKLSMRLKCVCKHWNRVISDPNYLTKSWRGHRKILLPFEPVDVLEENDTTRSMVTLNSSPFGNLEEGKVVTFAGSCNGIVLLVIQDFRNLSHDITHMVFYNPLTRATSKPIPDDLHSECNNSSNHVYGFGYGSSNPDDLKIVRFRGCEFSFSSSANDNRHTCDVFSTKTNSWTVLENFVQHANSLNDVGTFANGSLYWIANKKYKNDHYKIVALDVNNMVLSDIHLPNVYKLDNRPRDIWSDVDSWYVNLWSVLGTLNGCLCIVAQTITSLKNDGFSVWEMKEEGVEKSWVNVSSFKLNLKFEFGYSPICILDDGNVLIGITSFQEIVIYDALKKGWPKVINVSASPGYFQRIHGIEYVESLVSPSSLFK